MEHKDKIVLIVVSVVSGLIILGLLIGLIVVGTKSCKLTSVSWSTPDIMLTSLATAADGTTLGPVLISYSPNFENLWTGSESTTSTLALQSVATPNPKTHYWNLVSRGLVNGWYPFQIIQQSNPNNQVIVDINNNNDIALATSGNWAQVDNNGCNTLQIQNNGTFLVGPQLTTISAPSSGCTGSVPIYIGILPMTNLSS